jgi:hypothetical protein
MSPANISLFSNNKTANTCLVCAEQRAENLAALGVKSVIELCVGPSLAVLEKVYKQQGIFSVAGNDIDPRWKEYYPKGKWIIGDARQIEAASLSMFDAAVVAPPLSRGCSGRREDALGLTEVQPAFESFLGLPNKVKVFVLPGKTLSLSKDKSDLHAFMSKIKAMYPTSLVDFIPLKNKVTKYVDVYVY